jgi:rifampicin phosphotransferase
MTEQIYSFNTKKSPLLTEVGGKAQSLISTTQAGLAVPEGLALTVSFFQPWTDTIKGTDQWKVLLQNPVKENCDKIKTIAEKLILTEDQKSQLDKAMAEMKGTEVFAVRSSSPEEDLAGSSFAGMYETYLGTTRDQLEETIARAYSSMFDFRVMEYKTQNSIGLEGTCISVIIQKQIASDVSGVGFSLNPMNNCYDEVMINASFGLGEAIVSGIVTPDTYVYDAVEKRIIEKKVNKKEIALWLKENGGIEEKENTNKEEQALTDEQIIELSGLIKKCEEHYDKPMDTEWAYEKDKLYLLQARPITTHLPFFEELMTKPGESKNFYVDLIIMTQGFDQPMSVLGLELWAKMLVAIKPYMNDVVDGTTPTLHGRQYISLSVMSQVVGKKSTDKFIQSYDSNLKRIFSQVDYAASISKEKTPGVKEAKKGVMKSISVMLPAIMKALFVNYRSVMKGYNIVGDQVIARSKELSKDDDFDKNATEIINLFSTIMSVAGGMILGMLSMQSMKKMFKGEDIEKEIIALAMDLDGNPTSAMGYLLYKMACYDEFQKTSSREDFIGKCKKRNYSEAFLKDYDEFMDKYAVRGINEIDVASVRAFEDVGLLYDKIKDINIKDNQLTGVKDKKQAAYETLLEAARAKGKEKQFVKAAEKYQATFGYREHPKYVIVYALGMLHNICLEMAEEWVEAGRLEKPYQIFDLHIDEITRGQKDSSFDLMTARKNNLEGYEKTAHVKEWPLVIDSRGKIYKPKMEIKEGDIVGDPIAPGKITGKAKIMRTPFEKALNPGEILITRATEPSWTPIFINAAGVIMEIGGPLQHGGIIAREYGIPCVSGLIGIMDMVKDGDLLEVDGSNGIVKILEPA